MIVLVIDMSSISSALLVCCVVGDENLHCTIHMLLLIKKTTGRWCVSNTDVDIGQDHVISHVISGHAAGRVT